MTTQISRLAIVLGTLALSSLSSFAAEDHSAEEQEIRKIEQDWVAAIKGKDGSFLQRLEADDYVMTGPDGLVLDKASDIKDVTSGDTVFDELKIDSLKVRFYGNTAITNGVGTAKAHQHDKDVSGQYAWTDVFVKQDGQWKAVSAHVTPVAKPESE